MHHTLDASTTVHRWDNRLPPRLTIAPGDRLTLEMLDASGGQVRPGMSSAEFAGIDKTRIHALTGPVAVEGAKPGDRLEVKILDYAHRGWAWTSIIPGMGLLPEDFPDHFLFHWELEDNCTRSMPGVVLDLHPFCGIIGVQRDEAGEFRTRAPGIWGGNMDVKHLTAGAELFLPVLVPGAGLCAGDCHAAQGDGEVSINGMEAPMQVTFEIELMERDRPTRPCAIVPPELTPPRYRTKPWLAFIESAEDAREACKAVVRRVIDFLTHRLEISPEMAYVLCSVVLDLKVSQLVNAPTTTITGYLPTAMFEV
ncbi:MAG: acetamidase/formamidase family protein [Opitutales bacterium]